MAKESKKREYQAQRERQTRNQGRKLNQWRQDRMRGAIAEYKQIIEDGGVPQLRLLARAWQVPKSTLQRRVKGDGHYNHMIGRKPFIGEVDEAELAEMIATLGKRGFPLTFKHWPTSLPKKKGIKGFSDVKRKVGYKWFQGFLRRNPNLSK